MRNNRRVVLKTERFRKIRYNLRRIIINSVYDEFEILGNFASLYGAPLDLTPQEEIELYRLEGKRQNLLDALSKSICKCDLCSKDDRDMVYIKIHDAWYCTKCQDDNLIWYPSMGSEEVPQKSNYISVRGSKKHIKKDHKKDRE